MRLLPCTVAVLLALGACRPPASVPPDPSPEAVWRQFAAAGAQGDLKTAWKLLSTGTQAELTRQAEAISKARGGASLDGPHLAFGDYFGLRHDIRAIGAAEKDGKATLHVADDAGGEQVVSLVREAGGWRIDLAAELQKAHLK